MNDLEDLKQLARELISICVLNYNGQPPEEIHKAALDLADHVLKLEERKDP